MFTLNEWATRWGLPQQALDELAMLSVVQGEVDSGKSEGNVQSRVRLEAAKKGIYLWRNNVGAGKVTHADDGVSRFMRWGLANDSAKLNEVVKSADLIGLRRTLVTQAMVGTYVGIFYSRELKPEGWKFSGTLRECAQLQWATLINAQGGDAMMVSALGSFD